MYTEFMSLLVSSQNLINSSEARKTFGHLLEEVSLDEEKYFVILENGRVKALLVNPHWIEKGLSGDFPALKSLRMDWSRHQEGVEAALDILASTPANKLPKLLR